LQFVYAKPKAEPEVKAGQGDNFSRAAGGDVKKDAEL